MPFSNFPIELRKFEIQAFEKPTNIGNLRKTHVAFSGSIQKHPLNHQKIILVADPYSTSPSYVEFSLDDIGYAEDMTNIVTLEGDTVHMVRIWVKKGSLGMHCSFFVVEDIREKHLR